MDLAMLNIPMHGCIPVYNDIIFKWVQAEFALPSTYVGPWCLVSPRVSVCIFHSRHCKNLNAFFLVSVVVKLLDDWKYISSVTALTRHPLSLLPPSLLLQVMSSTCPMTMWKHVRRYLGNWRTITWCLLHWFRSTGAGPGLCAAPPSLPSSWTEVMVSKHFLYLSLEPKKSVLAISWF